MANVENRAAEHGCLFIADTAVHSFNTTKPAVVIRILEDTVIAAITANNAEGIDYYVGKSLDITSPVILANVVSIQLTSGAVQAVFN